MTNDLYHGGKSEPVTITGWNEGEKRADIQLVSFLNSSRVFWSVQGNSYVVVLADHSDNRWRVDDRTWLTEEGKHVWLLSINGHGEARWSVPYSGSTAGDLDAAKYFRLKEIKS